MQNAREGTSIADTHQKQYEYSLVYVLIFSIIVVLHIGFAIVLLSEFGMDQSLIYAVLFFSAVTSVIVGYVFVKSLLEPQITRNQKLKQMLAENIHELNVPLSTIKTNAGMLKKLEMDEKNKRRLERILLASEKLYQQYERMEYEIKSEIFSIEKEEFDLAGALSESLQGFEGRHSILIKDISPMMLYTDRFGFIRLLDNLLENAIKHSATKEPVEISLKDTVLSVRDYGKGMDEVVLLQAFERHFQGDTSIQGMGLGLNMVKRYCQENMIGISIDSRLGEGTKVSLSLKKVLIQH